MIRIHKLKLPLSVAAFVFAMLSIVQLKMADRPMLVFERFWTGAGWLQILLTALYGAFVAYHMQDSKQSARWRKHIWTLFSVVFFGQLALGLLGVEQFLMTGKLHLPIPVMILAGPIYRLELSFMTFLFLSTIVLTGPAWCSQLCYFGAMDSRAASGKRTRKPYPTRPGLKAGLMSIVVVTAIALRWFHLPFVLSTAVAIAFGLIGIGVMLLVSRKQKRMIHCTQYCPIGTIVSLLKPINPFRMYIDRSCDRCMQCIPHCSYNALSAAQILKNKPGFNCTYCGDCVSACPQEAIRYRLFRLSPSQARMVYLWITLSLHAIFLALAKI